MNIHESLRAIKSDSEQFKVLYKDYAAKYLDRVLTASELPASAKMRED